MESLFQLNSVKINLTAVVTVLVMVGGGIAIAIFLRRPGATGDAGRRNFHPDAAVEFYWTAGDITFAERRSSYIQPWGPPVAPDAVERKLKPLANVKLENIKPLEKGEVNVTVGFGGENRWSGIYHDGVFTWTAGLKKGFGFYTDKNWRKTFEEGRYAFHLAEENICPTQPQKIVLQLDVTYEFEKNQGHWLRKTNGKSETFDSAFIEKWFGKNCIIKIDYFRDLGLFPFRGEPKRGTLLLIFPDGRTMIWTLFGDFWEVEPRKSAVNSEQLDLALRQLTGT